LTPRRLVFSEVCGMGL